MKTTLTIEKSTYELLIKKKMRLSSKMGYPITWDTFFEKMIKRG